MLQSNVMPLMRQLIILILSTEAVGMLVDKTLVYKYPFVYKAYFM